MFNLDLIKKYEGLRLKAYKCPAGVWTIGYGRTTNVKPGDVITEKEADIFLLEEVEGFNIELKKSLSNSYDNLNINQITALLSFIYNLGISNFNKSTLRKKLLVGDYLSASKEFIKWNKANGKALNGLTLRRKEEANIFLS